MLKKSVQVLFLAVLCLGSFLTGCRNYVASDSSEGFTEYGSLAVLQGSRQLDLSKISHAKITVTGTGISSLGISSDFVQTSDGKNTGTVIIPNIPVGKNRIVTVQGYDAEKTAIVGAVIRDVVDINTGTNTVSVTQQTTALGNVFNSLLASGVNIKNVNKNTIASKLDSTKPWSLLNTAKLASDYMADSSLNGRQMSDYYVKTGTVKVTSTLSGFYTIKILDPASKPKAITGETSITDVAPGTWSFQIFEGDNLVKSGTLKVVEEKDTTISLGRGGVAPDLSGKLIIFIKSESPLWAWENTGYSMCEDGLGETWNTQTSTVPATASVMADPSGWYMKDFSSIKQNMTGKEIYFILNKESTTIQSGCTSTFWYDGTNFFTEDPSATGGSSEILVTVQNPAGGTGGGDTTDRIVVYAKYRYVYLWGNGNSNLEKVCLEMQDAGGGWYTYEIPSTTSNMIFKPNAGDDWNGKTTDLSRTAGVWWYLDGRWSEYNPEDSIPPVLESFTSDKSGTVSGEVEFTVTASDNLNLDRAEISINGTKIATVALLGKTQTKTAVWNSAYVQNGTYTVKCVVYDVGGNASDEKSITLSTSNANLPPVAVIKGPSTAVIGSEKTYSAENSYDQNGGTIISYTWTVTGAAIKSGQGTSSIVVSMPSSTGTQVGISLVVKDNENASSTAAAKTVSIVESANGDFRDETIYFLMTTRFYDGDSTNNEYCWDEGGEYLQFSDGDCAWRGDFKGLAQKLDYIKALGFSAVWITPVVVNASGIDYHGYHAYDFSTVDPRYESAGFTYQDLIDACHSKGMKVIQDIVLNHTGNFGEKNIFRMFEKDTAPYVNPDISTPTSTPRSPFMSVAADGNAYQKLMAGLAMTGAGDYNSAPGATQYAARINAMKEDSTDTEKIYHHEKMIDWNSENCQLGQMAGDCVDLNTENPAVFNYLKDCYVNYINMGVDAFRIDTVKHISRLTFNKEFIPAFMEAGGESFYIFGETCARYRGRWNEGVPALSPSFYTWKETQSFNWSSTDADTNSAAASAHFTEYRSSYAHPGWADGVANHLLNGNSYHAPDYSNRSYLDQIDFPMHWAFNSVGDAFSTAVGTNDPDFNDATWNVTYVDSHDYAPDNAPESQRFTGNWPDKLNLMFTFRGIPCIYYGSEIEFKKGFPIDPANARTSLEASGRAYFGSHLEGNVVASDFGAYTASGTVAETLNHPLAKHIIRLNKIRRAIPALRKGQYSVQNCSGGISFKRRYTDENVDSFVLVTINGDATFSGLPGGTYIDVVTGDVKNVSNGGSLSTSGCGENNMRVYVNTSLAGCEVTGKIGESGTYLK